MPTIKMTHADTPYVQRWIADFDQYVEEAQECEDRRWTKKENERMRDFALWFFVKYNVKED